MNIKNHYLFILTLCGVAFFVGCGAETPSTLSSCYDVEGTLVIITPDAEEITGPEGKVSYDAVTIVDELGEQVTAGEIRGQHFYYGDGSSLEFSEQEVLGSGGLIDGVRGNAVTCP